MVCQVKVSVHPAAKAQAFDFRENRLMVDIGRRSFRRYSVLAWVGRIDTSEMRVWIRLAREGRLVRVG